MGSALLPGRFPPPLPPSSRPAREIPRRPSQTTEDHPFKIIIGTGRCIKPRTPCALISDLRVPVLLRGMGWHIFYHLCPTLSPSLSPFPLRLGSVWLGGFILSCTMMATRTSSINARAPTHRAIRPASSQKTHRRSLLCRAEDTQTSGTYGLLFLCTISVCFVLVLVFVLFCLPSWLCPAVFVVRSSSRSCKVHASKQQQQQQQSS